MKNVLKFVMGLIIIVGLGIGTELFLGSIGCGDTFKGECTIQTLNSDYSPMKEYEVIEYTTLDNGNIQAILTDGTEVIIDREYKIFK